MNKEQYQQYEQLAGMMKEKVDHLQTQVVYCVSYAHNDIVAYGKCVSFYMSLSVVLCVFMCVQVLCVFILYHRDNGFG